MNLILCGMPMCGKSHFGKKAAKRLKIAFIDTDLLIEQSFKLSCREIALKYGEAAFRKKEKEIIRRLEMKDAIVATGGGALLDEENIKALKAKGILVYLKQPAKVLLERLKKKEKIPSYLDPKDPEESFLDLMKKRIEIYEKSANLILDMADQSEEEIVSALCRIGEKNGQQ